MSACIQFSPVACLNELTFLLRNAICPKLNKHKRIGITRGGKDEDTDVGDDINDTVKVR